MFVTLFLVSVGVESSIEERLRNEFRAADADQDGFLLASELQSAVNKCGVTLSEVRMKEVMRVFDTKQNGTVEYEKICRIFQPSGFSGSRTPSPTQLGLAKYFVEDATAPPAPRRKLSDAQSLDQQLNSPKFLVVTPIYCLVVLISKD